MGTKKIIADKNLECCVCGNTTWRHKQRAEEPSEHFHYWIAPSTDLALRERKQRLGTWDSTFRSILAGYDAYRGIQERQRIKDVTGISTVVRDMSQEE